MNCMSKRGVCLAGTLISMSYKLKNRSLLAGFFLLVVTAIGTSGYYLLGLVHDVYYPHHRGFLGNS